MAENGDVNGPFMVENGPFIVDFAIKHGDVPSLC